jgi:hypothetical protein
MQTVFLIRTDILLEKSGKGICQGIAEWQS